MLHTKATAPDNQAACPTAEGVIASSPARRRFTIIVAFLSAGSALPGVLALPEQWQW
jgi:hypothetical protein